MCFKSPPISDEVGWMVHLKCITVGYQSKGPPSNPLTFQPKETCRIVSTQQTYHGLPCCFCTSPVTSSDSPASAAGVTTPWRCIHAAILHLYPLEGTHEDIYWLYCNRFIWEASYTFLYYTNYTILHYPYYIHTILPGQASLICKSDPHHNICSSESLKVLFNREAFGTWPVAKLLPQRIPRMKQITNHTFLVGHHNLCNMMSLRRILPWNNSKIKMQPLSAQSANFCPTKIESWLLWAFQSLHSSGDYFRTLEWRNERSSPGHYVFTILEVPYPSQPCHLILIACPQL